MSRMSLHVLRPISEEDLDDLVELHMDAFKEHLNILLGKVYIRHFLKWFSDGEDRISLVALVNDTVVGYVVGAKWGYQSEINRDLFTYALRGLFRNPIILLKSRVRKNALSRLKTLLKINRSIEQTKTLYKGEILSLVGIGVKEDAKGLGISSGLMREFVQQGRKKNYDYARLSVYSNNYRARKFYENHNWVLEEPDEGLAVGYYYDLRS